MAESLLNIKKRIMTIESIKKITHAMKLISSSRYTKLSQLFNASSEYVFSLKKAMNICLRNSDFTHANMPTCMKENPNGDKNLYILITPTLGLCGNFFHSIEKVASPLLNKDVDVIFIGEKGFKKYHKIVGETFLEYINLNENISWTTVNKFRHWLDALYLKNAYKSIHIIYTKYINQLNYKVISKQLIPLEIDDSGYFEAEVTPQFDQDPSTIADSLVPHYLDALLYRYLIESSLCEHSSRQNSMQNATESADKLLDELKLRYNKTRQTNITNEITELTGSISNDKVSFL